MTLKFRNRLSALSALGVLAITSLVVSACSGTSANAGGEGGDGGELVHAVTALDGGWQQQASNDWYKSQVWTQLVETLVYVDDAGEVHPWLADEWEESADGLTYTISLHDGVTFSDGTPLDAEIVAKNLNVLGHGDEDKGIARSSIVPGEFTSAEAVDELTVKVTLSSPNRGFIASLGFFAAGIIGESTLDASLEEQSDLENLVATGPFVVESETPGKEIIVTKRDDYDWASPAFDHDGPAHLDKIIFSVVAEDGSRLGALESGQIDSSHRVQPNEETRLQDEGFNITYGNYSGTPINFALRPNTELLSDVKVRQAIQHGIDRDDLVKTVYNENWKPATSSVQSAVPGWVDLSDELEFDQDQSNKLLDEAGWSERDAEGYRVRDGERLTIPGYTSPNLNTTPELLELIAQHLKQIGIEVKIERTDASTYPKALANPSVPIIPIANSFLDATTLRQYWGQDFANQFFLEDGELEGLLTEVTESALGSPERLAALEELQHTTIEQAYTVPLVDNYQVFVSSDRVSGIETNAVGRPYFYDTSVN